MTKTKTETKTKSKFQILLDKVKMMEFIGYQVNIFWDGLESNIKSFGLIVPDFQRSPDAWTEDQRRMFIEFILKGGTSASDIYINEYSVIEPYVLVDGLQRITSVRRFLNNEFPIFLDYNHKKGYFFKDLDDKLPRNANFVFKINKLKSREAVLKWYIDLNEGGTIHTKEDIDKVRDLLEKERQTKAKKEEKI
jgi:hypothetical protein